MITRHVLREAQPAERSDAAGRHQAGLPIGGDGRRRIVVAQLEPAQLQPRLEACALQRGSRARGLNRLAILAGPLGGDGELPLQGGVAWPLRDGVLQYRHRVAALARLQRARQPQPAVQRQRRRLRPPLASGQDHQAQRRHGKTGGGGPRRGGKAAGSRSTQLRKGDHGRVSFLRRL
ncbi:hypothetical protein ACFQY5_03805 [Paeniroseomonas aquatica]|uniref:hypothetical protein n=1 Tax=Paeniroseomonas aquatica TaxID=373043 RepID=UPI003614737D